MRKKKIKLASETLLKIQKIDKERFLGDDLKEVMQDITKSTEANGTMSAFVQNEKSTISDSKNKSELFDDNYQFYMSHFMNGNMPPHSLGGQIGHLTAEERKEANRKEMRKLDTGLPKKQDSSAVGLKD